MTENKLSLVCPKCKAHVTARQSTAGQRVRCPKCSATIKVPGAVASDNDDDDWLQLDEPVAKQGSSSKDPVPTASQDSKQSASQSPVKNSPVPSLEIPASSSSEFTGKTTAPHAEPPADDQSGTDVLGAEDVVDDDNDSQLPDISELDLDAMQFPGTVTPPAPSPDEVQPEAAADAEYRFACPVCDSAHYAKPSHQGRKKKCTDCHSTIQIPAPPAVKPTYNPSLETAPTFSLQKPVDRSAQAASLLEKSAEQLLKEAEDAQLDEDLDQLYENPDVAGWFKDVFSIFGHPGAILSFVFVAVASILCSFVISWAVERGPVFMATVGIPAGMLALACIATSAFAVVQATVNREVFVKDWPVTDPGGWAGRGILVMAAVGLSAAPGAVLATVAGAEPFGLGWSSAIMFTVYLLCPIVLLSMVEHDSVLMPYSKDVVASFQQCQEQWGGLYFTSGLLFCFYFLLLAASPPTPIAAIFLVAVGFIYGRLVGRVAYAIGQSVGGVHAAADPDEQA